MTCDSGDRYADTYDNKDWRIKHDFDVKMKKSLKQLEGFY